MNEGRGIAAPPEAFDEGGFQRVTIDQVKPMGRNTRQIDETAEAFLELVASVKEVGILQPIVVRFITEVEGYELLAGERRLRAAKAAGMEFIPAIVRNLDEGQASTVTAVENMQREDLAALEEAAGIQKLLDSGMTQQEAAKRLGKSERWVRRRLSLLNLADGWKKEHADPKSPVSNWPAANLEVLARLPADVQEGVLSSMKRNYNWNQNTASISREDLERNLAYLTHALSMAPWKLSDEEILPRAGACNVCPKRSSVEPMLFDPVSTHQGGRPQKGDRCLDGKCWKSKRRAGLAKREAEYRAKHPKLLLVTCGESRVKGALMTYQVSSCKKADVNARPAMHVDGSQAGKLVWVTKNRNATGISSPGPRVLTLRERRKQLAQKRLAEAVNQIEEKVKHAEWPLDGGEKIGAWDAMLVVLARLAATLGAFVQCSPNQGWKAMAESETWSEQKLAEKLWSAVRDEIENNGLPMHWNATPSDKPAMKQICGLVGASYDELWAEACLQHPEPPEWKQLKADGTPKAKPEDKKKAAAGKSKKKPAKKKAKK